MAWNRRGQRSRGWGNGGRDQGQGKPREFKLPEVEAKAMQFLAMRDHSEDELRSKLKQRNYPQDLIDEAVARMKSYNYLDDERAARSMARMLISQCWGPYQIKGKLKQKGFSEAEIEQALEELVQEDTWLESARQRLYSKFRKEAGELDEDERQKAYRHLTYRGFGGDVVRKALFSQKTNEL